MTASQNSSPRTFDRKTPKGSISRDQLEADLDSAPTRVVVATPPPQPARKRRSWLGGVMGSGSGATDTPSSTSDLACSRVARP